VGVLGDSHRRNPALLRNSFMLHHASCQPDCFIG
jgi:hypothetical protein